MSFLTS